MHFASFRHINLGLFAAFDPNLAPVKEYQKRRGEERKKKEEVAALVLIKAKTKSVRSHITVQQISPWCFVNSLDEKMV